MKIGLRVARVGFRSESQVTCREKENESHQGSSDAEREAPRLRHAPARGAEALDQSDSLDQGGGEGNPEEKEGKHTEDGEPSRAPARGGPAKPWKVPSMHSGLCSEQGERCVRRHMLEILVGRQQLKAVPNAQLSDESIDRTNLDSLAPAHVPQSSRFNVVIDFRRYNRQ